jgi:hypothetical protein
MLIFNFGERNSENLNFGVENSENFNFGGKIMKILILAGKF